MYPLKGKVALVAGASRGAGRGIALELGNAGATVYVTGRSSGSKRTDGRPETIEDTASAVTSRGGTGIAVPCDHTDEQELERLFARIKLEHGRIDLLVNSIFGGSEDSVPRGQGRHFWERPNEHWDAMMVAGPKAYLSTIRHAVPLLQASEHAVVINITSFTDSGVASNLYYDLAMNTINRMTYVMAKEFETLKISVVALSPGWMRTERVLDAGFNPEDGTTETTAYVGRAVVALANDLDKNLYSGQTLTVAALSAHYGFTDIDGSRPSPF
ncbi:MULTISPECIES: SDR family NAD(P)-dependent oxidoreductase [Exiguobacterium]|uniref:SDR family NAD(P)-dependent oxidoreductase n=1 Tax=Exiguobacterium TaxID=33986 RepID=UPI001BEBE65A|nr:MULTISPECIES: SDR family NAD(P)-dependent oxidoreductase [Exiguobacterium]MCT4776833.1 SDR family NAD(P)-dependent oxidoreductase [Exiguobacterium aquaticum]MCT4788271.1 SDR family NAD(P)-dependent oxidoreductase [Exiguobacterium mexicanum]